jgi:hypothetical protein
MLVTGKVFGGSGVGAAIAEAPMKAEPRLGLALSRSRVTSAFLIDVAVLILASHSPIPAPQTVAWRVGVAVATMVTIAFVLTYRGITVASVLARRVWDLSADMWDSSPDPEATLSPGCTPAIDHRRRFGRDVVGVRQYRGQLVAAIAVDGPADAPSGQHQRQTVSPATLPVAAVAAALRQFDVRLDAIDIASVRKRHGCEAADPCAPPTVDDRPAGIEHGMWLVVRMDELRRMIPELRALVGFNRGDWSPALFADLHAAGFDTLTWRKGAALDIKEDLFAEHTHTDEHRRRHTWRLADTYS